MFNTQRIWWWLRDQRSKCCPLETEFISNTLNRLMNHSWHRAEKHYLATESHRCFIIKGNFPCNIDNNQPQHYNNWLVKCKPLIVLPQKLYPDFHIKWWRWWCWSHSPKGCQASKRYLEATGYFLGRTQDNFLLFLVAVAGILGQNITFF